MAQSVVVGSEGGGVVLPCTINIQVGLRWAVENIGILFRHSGQGYPENTPWENSISLVGSSNNLSISYLSRQRDDGKTFSCQETGAAGGHQDTTVRVLSPSDVAVTFNQRSHQLTCTAEGYPNIHTFGPWEHRLDGILIRRLGKETLGTSISYTLPENLTYTDTGDYVCSATNGIMCSQSGRIYVAPLTPAVYQNHPQKVTIGLGRSETMSVSFYARSSSGAVRVKWEKAGESDALQSHQEAVTMVSLVLYGQLVSLPGTVTILTLTDVRQADEGNYTVTVTSDINGVTRASSTNFFVDVTENPSTENDVTVEPNTETGKDVKDLKRNEANTTAIVGGVLGGLGGLVILTGLVVIFYRRSRTEDIPEDADNREMSPAGELSGEMRISLRVADTSLHPAINTDNNYESLAHNIARNPGSRDGHFESMTSPTRSGDITYQNSESAESTARAAQSDDLSNYQNV